MAEMKYVVLSEASHVIHGPHEFEVAAEIAGNLVRAGRTVSINPCPDHAAYLDELIAEGKMTKEYPVKQWTGQNQDEIAEFIGADKIEKVMEHPTSGAKTMYVWTSNGLKAMNETDYVGVFEGGLEFFTAEDIELMGNVKIVDEPQADGEEG